MKDDIPPTILLVLLSIILIGILRIDFNPSKRFIEEKLVIVNGSYLVAIVPPVMFEEEVLGTVVEPLEKMFLKGSEMREITGIISMYNNLPDQTDSTPNINARGLKVQNGDIANNCLQFGSKVLIGGKVYTVNDRMNSRYSCEYFDIFSFDYDEAIQFGRRKLVVSLSI